MAEVDTGDYLLSWIEDNDERNALANKLYEAFYDTDIYQTMEAARIRANPEYDQAAWDLYDSSTDYSSAEYIKASDLVSEWIEKASNSIREEFYAGLNTGGLGLGCDGSRTPLRWLNMSEAPW